MAVASTVYVPGFIIVMFPLVSQFIELFAIVVGWPSEEFGNNVPMEFVSVNAVTEAGINIKFP